MASKEIGTVDGYVTSECTDSIRLITLSRPQRRNALSPALRNQLIDAIESAMQEPACRVLVLTGANGHFCAGGDIGSFEPISAIAGRTRMQDAQRLARAVTLGDKPVIAAVEGHASGAGLCLAAACDIVVASASAKFTCSFNRVGLLPDLGGLWSIPQRIGLGRTKMLMLSGKTLCASEAERQGLVEVLSETGRALTTAMSLAKDVAQFAPLAHRLIKSLMARGPQSFDSLLAAEADAQGILFASEDFHEGVSAFLEKRTPQFFMR